MKQNIMIVLLSVIAALLGYLAVEWKDSREAQAVARGSGQGQLERERIYDGGYISPPRHEYPKEAKKKEAGEVEVEFIINKKNEIENPKVIKSSGFQVLDNAALDTLKKNKYRAKKIGEQPVTSIFRIKFAYYPTE